MNIFVLDESPKQAAVYHNDKHVVKMILESAQMLHAPYYETNTPFDGFPRTKGPYKLTHKNHPCTRWTCKSLDNWSWLLDLALELCDEYTYRYTKTEKQGTLFPKRHACQDMLEWMKDNPPQLDSNGMSPFALAMPDELKSNDAVESYRRYYMTEKRHIASWTKRNTPEWYK